MEIASGVLIWGLVIGGIVTLYAMSNRSAREEAQRRERHLEREAERRRLIAASPTLAALDEAQQWREYASALDSLAAAVDADHTHERQRAGRQSRVPRTSAGDVYRSMAAKNRLASERIEQQALTYTPTSYSTVESHDPVSLDAESAATRLGQEMAHLTMLLQRTPEPPYLPTIEWCDAIDAAHMAALITLGECYDAHGGLNVSEEPWKTFGRVLVLAQDASAAARDAIAAR